MKRDLSVISKVISFAISTLHYKNKEEQLSKEDINLIAENVNADCSGLMLDDMYQIITMASERPTGRFCDRNDCNYYRRDKMTASAHNIKCKECLHNLKSKDGDMDHFEPE